MKHSLQLKLSQHLTLTPQLQQSIRLLQLSTLELNQELDLFIQENPLLERVEQSFEEEPKAANLPTNGETPNTPIEREESRPEAEHNTDFPEPSWDEASVHRSSREDDDDDQEFSQFVAEEISLREHLNWQLNLLQLSSRDKTIVSLLIDALNDDGYLTQDLEELLALLPEELEIELIELETGLKHLQFLDPCGVGARNLAECLSLQLQALDASTPYRDTALQLVNNHLEILAARDYARLKKIFQCDDTCLRETQRLITGLNPRPGSKYSAVQTRYITHDVVVKKVKGLWVATLNTDAMPRLRINRMYADILQRNRDSSMQQLTSQLQEARWMIKNVQQRFDTILRVSQAIIDRQRHFFEHGEVAMRPLVLREIAEAVNLHESTVSRVTTQKYMLTPRGLFELKYFFGSHVATEAGGACSATAIRALIRQLVGAEDHRKPLSDSQIMEILGNQGIVVARRTIAKYREALQIPPVNLRKAI